MWVWNRAQQPKVHALEMSYLRERYMPERYVVCGELVVLWSGEMAENQYVEVIWT